MLVKVVDGLVVFVNKEPVANQVRVSDAQVVVMVAQVSPKETLEEFVSEVVGFEVFVSDILFNDYLHKQEPFVFFHPYFYH